MAQQIQLSAYPIQLNKTTDLVNWIVTLPVGHIHIDEPNARKTECYCDVQLHPITVAMLDAFDPSHDVTILLPCGCKQSRRRIEIHLRRWDHCPDCGFELFEPFSLDPWFKNLPDVDIKTLPIGDECGICQEMYSEKSTSNSERCPGPVRLPCNHCFGARCLREWLSPAPDGGNGNSCPKCRRQLFPPWPVEGDSSDDEEDEEEDEDGVALNEGPDLTMNRTLEEALRAQQELSPQANPDSLLQERELGFYTPSVLDSGDERASSDADSLPSTDAGDVIEP